MTYWGEENNSNTQDVEVMAADQIRVGDAMYVVDNAPKDLYADDGRLRL